MTTLNLTLRPGYDKRTKALVSDMLDYYCEGHKWNGRLECVIAEYIPECPTYDTDEMITNLISMINEAVREAAEEFENRPPGKWGAVELVEYTNRKHGEYTVDTVIDEYVSDMLADVLYLIEETLKRL